MNALEETRILAETITKTARTYRQLQEDRRRDVELQDLAGRVHGLEGDPAVIEAMTAALDTLLSAERVLRSARNQAVITDPGTLAQIDLATIQASILPKFLRRWLPKLTRRNHE